MSTESAKSAKKKVDRQFSYAKTKGMANGIQTKVAIKTGLSATFISLLIKGKRRPTWANAKKIAAVTATDPMLWLEGTPKQMQKALANLRVITSFELKPKRPPCRHAEN